VVLLEHCPVALDISLHTDVSSLTLHTDVSSLTYFSILSWSFSTFCSICVSHSVAADILEPVKTAGIAKYNFVRYRWSGDILNLSGT
jgi:hypothetical protein